MNVELEVVSPEDGAIIQAWLKQAYVAKRWGEMAHDVIFSTDDHAIISVDGEKTGYIRWQHPTREELDVAGLSDISTDVIDIDIFIGVEANLGRGIGSEAVKRLFSKLEREAGVAGFIACAAVDNSASIRMFEKAGFEIDREFDDKPFGRHILLVKNAG